MTACDLYDPTDPETLRDPHAAYWRLREAAPAYFIEKWNTWAISRFEDIWKLSGDYEHLTAREGTTPPYLVLGVIEPRVNLNHMDPPEQQRLRAELMPHFLPRAMRELEPRVRSMVVDCIEPLVAAGQADAYSDVGQRIATRVASDAIGFPAGDREYILDLVRRFFAAIGGNAGSERAAGETMNEWRSYLERVAEGRREQAGAPESPIDTFWRSDNLGSPPTREAVGEHMVPLLAGATETFPKLAASSVYRLCQHPDQGKALVDDPGLCLGAVRECLRIDRPTQMSMRRVVNSLELHGQTLEPGQSVMLMWASGNPDEREFPDPDCFDIRRQSGRTLSFGNGIHRCIGAYLAELQARLMLEELLRSAPEYEVDEAGIETESTAFFQGYARMPLRF